MPDLLWLGLFMLAVGSGWWLGRRDWQPLRQRRAARAISDNHRLDGASDAALRRFGESLGVAAETFEAHLELGRQYRLRGDLQRATQTHQNLLGRPELERAQQARAQLELARDFLAAGVYSRAERLLLDLLEAPSALTGEALRALQRIYEHERDWAQAIETGRRLAAEDPAQRTALAHYACEWAGQCLRRGALEDARRLLEQALASDPACVRASLLLARLDGERGERGSAIRRLLQAADQDADFLGEILAPLLEHARQSHELERLERWLRERLETARGSGRDALLLTLAEVLQAQGAPDAGQVLRTALAEQPSLALLQRLLASTPAVDARLQEELQQAVARLQAEQPAWRCRQCGFQARQLHWQCPACHGWAVLRPRGGAARA